MVKKSPDKEPTILPGLPQSGNIESGDNPLLDKLLADVKKQSRLSLNPDSKEKKEIKEGESLLRLMKDSVNAWENQCLHWSALIKVNHKEASYLGNIIPLKELQEGPLDLKNYKKFIPDLEQSIKYPDKEMPDMNRYIPSIDMLKKMYNIINSVQEKDFGTLDKGSFFSNMDEMLGGALLFHLLYWVSSGRRIFHIPHKLELDLFKPITDKKKTWEDLHIPFESFSIELETPFKGFHTFIKGINIVFTDNAHIEILLFTDNSVQEIESKFHKFTRKEEIKLKKIALGRMNEDNSWDFINSFSLKMGQQNHSHVLKSTILDMKQPIVETIAASAGFGENNELLNLIVNLVEHLNNPSLVNSNLLVGEDVLSVLEKENSDNNQDNKKNKNRSDVRDKKSKNKKHIGLFDLGHVYNAQNITTSETRDFNNHTGRTVISHHRRGHMRRAPNLMPKGPDGFIGPPKPKTIYVAPTTINRGKNIPEVTVTKLK